MKRSVGYQNTVALIRFVIVFLIGTVISMLTDCLSVCLVVWLAPVNSI